MDVISVTGSESSDTTLKPIPREHAYLETLCYTLAQFQFDKAHELAEKEKEMFKPITGSNWMSLVNVLISLTYAEKGYFTMAFIEKKIFKQTMRPLFTGLLTDLSKQGDILISRAAHGLEALAVDLSTQLKQFINARLRMIDFYEFMAKSGLSHIQNTQEIIKAIKEISQEFSKEFHHPILDPLKTSFTYEVDLVTTLFQAELNLGEWNFFETLLLLRECQSKVHAWRMLSPSTSVKEQLLASFSYKSYFGRNKKASDDVPFLFQWLHHMYASLFSKFSFYFYTALSAQAPVADIKASLAKCSIDYMSKLSNFQKKTDSLSISLVLDTTTKKNIFRGHGYHLDNTIREKPTGMNSYPSVVIIPDLKPKEHWPNIISIINDQRDALKVTDKVIYFYDSKLESSYFLIKVDVRMTLVLIYNGKKKERDTNINSLLTDIRALLNQDKLYHMLRPGQSKIF